MDNEQDFTTKQLFRKWLEKLQQESWQLELLISGFALYGIYASKTFISELNLYGDKVSDPFLINICTSFLQVGWKIFFINLLVHVILRSLWIGAIGLRYVSGEIDYEQLNYSQKFTAYLEKKVGDYDDFIERLERICSVLFSYTFLLFLLFLSAILYFIVGMLPFILFDQEEMTGIAHYLNVLWFYPYLLFGVVTFVDFISLGGIKRVKDNFISKLFMPIYRFYSTITLSFLYRPLIYNFIDDKYTKKLFFLSIPYIMLVTFGHRIVSSKDNPHIADSYTLKSTGLNVHYNYYDDLVKEHRTEGSKLFENRIRLANLRLNAYTQEDEINSIFIKTRRKDKDILENVFGIEPHYVEGFRFSLFNHDKVHKQSEETSIDEKYTELFSKLMVERKTLRRAARKEKKEDKATAGASLDSLDSRIEYLAIQKQDELDAYNQAKHQKIMDGYKRLFHFSINGISYQDSLSCFFSTHSNNNERGLLCHYSNAQLPKGFHTIDFKRITHYEPLKSNRLDTVIYKVPFIKK